MVSFQADDDSVDAIGNLDNGANDDVDVDDAVDGDAATGHEGPASGSPLSQLTLLLPSRQLQEWKLRGPGILDL